VQKYFAAFEGISLRPKKKTSISVIDAIRGAFEEKPLLGLLPKFMMI